MKNFIVLIIVLWSISLASAAAFSPNDIEWAAAVSGNLNKGGTLSNGEYMVKAVQFPSPVQGVKDISGNWVPETDIDPMVYLEIYKNSTLIKELVMNQRTEAYIDPDYEVKVLATGFIARNAREWIFQFYKPWATISIQTRAKPKLEVTVTSDKTAYTSYDDMTITAKVTVKNSGEAFARNVDVNLNTGELKLRGGDISQLHQYYSKLEKGASRIFEVILVVPPLIDQKSYILSADAKGYDIKDLGYNLTGSISLTVSPKQNYFTISKALRDNMYLKDTALVTVTVSNGGMFDVYNINVTDSMNENFELKTNTSLQWDNIPVLKPGERRDNAYYIKPLEANLNGFTIPAVTAQFTVNNKIYNASSKTTTVVVNGPKIILNKTVNKAAVNISEDIVVNVSINNLGNIGTRIEVKDPLSDSVSLISGSTSLANWSDPNTMQGFSYTIRMDTEGEVQLPAATANYIDVEYRGTTRSVLSSDRPIITVSDPSKIPTILAVTATSTGTPAITPQEATAVPSSANTSAPASAPTAPGFDIMFAVIVLIITAVYRRR